jgi:DNA-binding transcriptional regulator GbsR (MarR family)
MMQTPYTAGWAKIPLDNLLAVNQLINSSSVFSVYCCMFRKLPLNGDNICNITQAEICETLGIKKSYVSRSVKKLIDLQVIAKHSSKHYMLNPQYTIRNVNDDYFGLADKFEKLIREDNDETKTNSTLPK